MINLTSDDDDDAADKVPDDNADRTDDPSVRKPCALLPIDFTSAAIPFLAGNMRAFENFLTEPVSEVIEFRRAI
jgi:hypothetical protein